MDPASRHRRVVRHGGDGSERALQAQYQPRPGISSVTQADAVPLPVPATFGAPAATNPAYAGGYTPYYFNHGIDATPIAMFFDGSVDVLPNAQVVADDDTVQLGGGPGLWSRDALGVNGYYGAQSYDGTIVSHHVLTIDGILGRDVLSAEPADGRRAGDVAARHKPSTGASSWTSGRDGRRAAPTSPPGSDLGDPEAVPLK